LIQQPFKVYSMTLIVKQLPEAGFLRIWQIIGNPKAEPPTPALIPIGRTSFLNGVKSGKYPKPVKLGERTTAWRVEDIRALIGQLGGML
jgi:prophage regulatory protein